MKTQTKTSKIIIAGKLVWDDCGHCRALIPEWNKMKNAIRTISKKTPNVFYRFVEIKSGPNEKVHIDKINNKYLKNSGEKLLLQGGYPTIFKISGGTLSYFNGASRNAEELQKFYLGNSEGGNREEETVMKNNVEEITEKLDNIQSSGTALSKSSTGFMDKLRALFGGRKTNKRRNNKNKKTQKNRK